MFAFQHVNHKGLKLVSCTLHPCIKCLAIISIDKDSNVREPERRSRGAFSNEYLQMAHVHFFCDHQVFVIDHQRFVDRTLAALEGSQIRVQKVQFDFVEANLVCQIEETLNILGEAK